MTTTCDEITPGELTLWLALFICLAVAWNWPDKE